MEKIAVISPDITNLGGISRCAVVLIEALNKKGIVPDYYGVNSDKKKIKELFNREIDYNFKRIFWPRKAILYSSWMKNLQTLLKDYDYVFDFTNTLPLNKNKGRYFSYILYPEFLTSRGKYSSGLWRVYYMPHQIMAFIQKKQFANPQIEMACVSKKVSDIIYGIFKKRYPVLYPPANIRDFQNRVKNKSGVISVGGLSHEKNQMEQIRIARKVSFMKFEICGNSRRNPKYYFELEKEARKVNNVAVCPNLPFPELKEKLAHAEVFLNSGREDPFCMALVEGIAAGCIPLIHDSGGVVEIVPFKELRYKTEEESVRKLRKIMALSKKEKEELRKKLSRHIEQFGEKHFVKYLVTMINHKVNKDGFPIGGKKYAS